MIVVDSDGIFVGIFNNNLNYTLFIPVHEYSRCNHKSIRNEVFHCYLNNPHKINSGDKGSFLQWLKLVFFDLYVCNSGPLNVTCISQSVLAISREFPFLINLSPSRSR